MEKTNSRRTSWFTFGSLIIAGVGIGVLVGLSVSPVVSIVITSVTGAAAAVVAALSGIESKPGGIVGPDNKPFDPRWRIDPSPLAKLITGIIVGAIVGIIIRNSSLFGSDISAEINKWETEGFQRKEVSRRLFELKFPYTPYTQDYTWIVSSHITATQALSSEVKMWEAVGLDTKEVARRLFEVKYPSGVKVITSTVDFSSNSGRLGTFLFGVDNNKLIEICSFKDSPNELAKSVSTTPIQDVLDLIEESDTKRKALDLIVRSSCSTNKDS